MVRGLKKKLLIGLLSAAVVGTSLAPNVPLVGSFAQEVKATDSELPEGMYKYTESTVSAVSKDDVFKWPSTGEKHYSLNDGTYKEISEALTSSSKGFIFIKDPDGDFVQDGDTYKAKTGSEEPETTLYKRGEETAVVDKDMSAYEWPASVVGKYKKVENSYVEIKSTSDVGVNAAKGATVKVYTKEKDNTKSSVTIKESENAKTKGYEVAGKGKSVVVEKGKDETVKVIVTAKTGKVIKNVIAKILDSNENVKQSLTATAVEGEKDVYSLTVKATEDTINLIVDAETETLKITPTLDTSGLSSKVGTASLASSSPVEYGNKITLTVNLAEGRTAADVDVKADAKPVSAPEKDGSVLTYKIDTTGVTKDSIKITVTGQLDNDDLDTEAKKDGSEATVANASDASGKKVAADANQVLEAAKAGNEGKNVKAALIIDEKTNVNEVDPVLTNNVSSRLTLDTDLNLAGYFAIDLYRVVVDAGETIPAGDITKDEGGQPTDKNKVTTLDSLLTVHYFLPSDAVGKKLYKVVRNHDGIGDITTTPNADGEYIEVDGNKLTLHVKNLSDFAVLYSKTDATTPDVPDPDPVPGPDPTPVKPDPTPVKPNPVKPSSDTGTKAAKVTTSTKKSTKTSSPKTADYAVNSLLALLTGAAGLFGITLINKKRKEDEE